MIIITIELNRIYFIQGGAKDFWKITVQFQKTFSPKEWVITI